MKEIKKLLGLWRNRSRASAEVKKLALSHIQELETKIQELERMRDALAAFARHCHGDNRPECPILAELAEEC
jgi:DNA-binding transcriptional MerR regulator